MTPLGWLGRKTSTQTKLLLQLPDNKDCIYCAFAWEEAKLGIVDWHQLSDDAVHNPLQDFHDLLCQLETAVVAPFHCIPPTLVEADNETLLPVGGYFAIVNDCSSEVTDHGVTGCSYHLHHYAWWFGALPAFIWEIAFLTILVVICMVGPSTGGLSDRWSGSSQTQCWKAFGSALTRPSALSLHSLTSPLLHSSPVCHQKH